MIAALTLLLAGCLNYGAVSSGPKITRLVVRFQVYFIVQIRLYIYLSIGLKQLSELFFSGTESLP